MAATNEELADDLTDLVTDLASNTVQEYRVGSRMVKRAHESIDKILDVRLKLQALASSRRGLSVARRTDVR